MTADFGRSFFIPYSGAQEKPSVALQINPAGDIILSVHVQYYIITGGEIT